ncbi:MAG: inositol monophosphatase [Candidatus Methanoplasma sp.]|nr:inositol monophosphatase [Candidatus Methanoplasma sp.]
MTSHTKVLKKSAPDLSEFVCEAVDIVSQAGSLILEIRSFNIESKGTKENYVTTSDIYIQNFLEEKLLALLPGSGFVGEEAALKDVVSEYCWIVDPIDGTANYARGIPLSVVSVALIKDDVPIVGIVFNPYLGQMFVAEKGKGAYLNGEAVRVSNKDFGTAMFSTAWSAYNKDWADRSFNISKKVHSECDDIRRLGTAAYELSLLASGSIDIYFEIGLYPWDYIAAYVLVTEAGGVIDSIDGGIDHKHQSSVLAANDRKNFDRLKQIILEELGDFRIPLN